VLVERLRDAGVQVLAEAGSEGGYYLAGSAADLVAYERVRRSGGLRSLVAAEQVARSAELADAEGQLGLFASADRPR
jgi:hypothetical protein